MNETVKNTQPQPEKPAVDTHELQMSNQVQTTLNSISINISEEKYQHGDTSEITKQK